MWTMSIHGKPSTLEPKRAPIFHIEGFSCTRESLKEIAVTLLNLNPTLDRIVFVENVVNEFTIDRSTPITPAWK